LQTLNSGVGSIQLRRFDEMATPLVKQNATDPNAPVQPVDTSHAVSPNEFPDEVSQSTFAIQALDEGQKSLLADAGQKFYIIDAQRSEEGINGAYWQFTIQHKETGEQRILFMSENEYNVAFYGAIHGYAVAQNKPVGPLVLQKIPIKKGPQAGKFFYKLEAA
jgi:hypothetical protein